MKFFYLANKDGQKIALEIQTKFLYEIEESINVIVYDEKNDFIKELMKNAKRITIEELWKFKKKQFYFLKLLLKMLFKF